jgi:hypothetical protein
MSNFYRWPVQLVLVGSCLLLQQSTVTAWTPRHPQNNDVNRRSALGKMIWLATGIFSAGNVRDATAQPPMNLPVLQSNTSESTATTIASSTEFSSATSSKNSKVTEPSFEAYYITPDETNVRSKLDKVDSRRFLHQMAASKKGGAVWLGEHHNSVADHDFQTTFIQEIHKQRRKSHQSASSNMAIGLEQVQQEFQPVLDAYIDGKISLERMRFMVQWDTRWTWNFDNYKSIFEAAKQLQIPLLALNVDSEDLSLVEKAGYPGLPKERLRKYIKDP